MANERVTPVIRSIKEGQGGGNQNVKLKTAKVVTARLTTPPSSVDLMKLSKEI